MKRSVGDYRMATKTRDEFYEKQHQKNLKAFIELGKRISKGLFKIVSIQIEEPQFGHRRIIIMIHDVEE